MTEEIETKTEREERDSKWYVLRVVSGKERKIKEYLDKDIIRNGWDKIVLQVFLPVEKVYKVLNGKSWIYNDGSCWREIKRRNNSKCKQYQ